MEMSDEQRVALTAHHDRDQAEAMAETIERLSRLLAKIAPLMRKTGMTPAEAFQALGLVDDPDWLAIRDLYPGIPANHDQEAS